MGYGLTKEINPDPDPTLIAFRDRFNKFCEKNGIVNKLLEEKSFDKIYSQVFKLIGDEIKSERTPYPHYDKGWPFYDIQNGSQKLKFVKPDWLEGMIEIKQWALKYYHNKEKYHADNYHGSTDQSIKEYKERIDPKLKSGEYKNWKCVLKDYEIKTKIAENDYKSLVYQRSENDRLQYIKELESAINFLTTKNK